MPAVTCIESSPADQAQVGDCTCSSPQARYSVSRSSAADQCRSARRWCSSVCWTGLGDTTEAPAPLRPSLYHCISAVRSRRTASRLMRSRSGPVAPSSWAGRTDWGRGPRRAWPLASSRCRT
eukprot:scaffold7031_cov254-Pinguiococcus_pyrenoidosus.AAC.2